MYTSWTMVPPLIPHCCCSLCEATATGIPVPRVWHTIPSCDSRGCASLPLVDLNITWRPGSLSYSSFFFFFNGLNSTPLSKSIQCQGWNLQYTHQYDGSTGSIKRPVKHQTLYKSQPYRCAENINSFQRASINTNIYVPARSVQII